MILKKNTTTLPCKRSPVNFPLNSKKFFPVIASKSEEEFDFSLSNVAAGVKKQVPQVSFETVVGDLI